MQANFTRDPSRLAAKHFDVLVVGGGIHGVCVARDAAMRGLSVALIEREDFGSATSHNSLKLIHGGIRYLQHFDIRRVRQSIGERRFWLACAPHLVQPIKCVMPAYGYGFRGVAALGAATKIFDALSLGCNRGVVESRRVSTGGILSRDAVVADLPAIDRNGLTGAMYWYDAQMGDADRVLLECAISAAEEGAVACNYVAADDLLVERGRVIGVEATDRNSGDKFEIRAAATVNTAGPWANKVVAGVLTSGASGRLAALSKCMNLVIRNTERLNLPSYAFSVVSRRPSDSIIDKSHRMFFVTPWNGLTIIGTSHLPYDGDPDDAEFTEDDIEVFLEEINDAYPFGFSIDDVVYCYGGLTPAEQGLRRDQVRRARHGEIIDHRRAHGLEGLISVIGVKYTTARLMAEQATDILFAQLDRPSPRCTTTLILLPGARNDGATRIAIDVTKMDLSSAAVLERLSRHVREVAVGSMAVTLDDLVFRRSNLAETGVASEGLIKLFAEAAGGALGWSEEKVKAEAMDTIGRLLFLRTDPEPLAETSVAGAAHRAPSYL